MKNCIFLICWLYGLAAFAQDKTVTKPKHVFISGEQIITEERVNEYAAGELIRSMQNGVSKDKREELAKKLGDQVGEAQFIILIDLYTPAERDSLQKLSNKTIIDKAPAALTQRDEFKLHPGDPAADFTVTLTNGTLLNLSALRGKVILMDFWATWCGPCIMEFYDIHNQLLIPYKDTSFIFLPVAIGEKPGVVQNKLGQLRKKGLTFHSGIDTDYTIWNNYASGSIPKNIIIDKKGVIRFVSGGNSEENIRKIKKTVQELLYE